MSDDQGGGNKSLSISRLHSPSDLMRHVDSLTRHRYQHMREWKLNLAFYRGKQYSWWNPHSRRIESLPVEDGEKPRYRVRLVSNQIAPGVHSYVSKLMKTKPTFYATPGSGADAEVKAAQMAESLLEYWWEEMDLASKQEEALLWSAIAGQGFWKIGWDAHAGKGTKFLLGPDGMPIVDESLKETFRAELQKFGVPPQEETVYLGDIKIEVLGPDHVLLDTNARVFEECKYAYCIHDLDPDEIEMRWGHRLEPDGVPAHEDVTVPFDNAENRAEKTVKRVYVGYFRPSPQLPQGRYVVFCDSPKTILYDGPWPYPFTDLPLIKFPGIRVPGSVWDDAVTTHARPLQKELNKTLSQIVHHKNLTINPRIWAPVGSLRTKITNEAGAVYEYLPIQGLRPEAEEMPTLQPYVFEALRDIHSRLNEQFGLTEVTEGSVPPNVEAGIAIDMLQEMATDRFAPTIQLMEQAMSRAGQLMLTLAQTYYIEPRLLKIRGSGGSVQVRKFQQADIQGGIEVRVQPGSALPRTRAGKQAMILEMVKAGIMPLEKAYKHLEIGDLGGMTAQFRAAEDSAYREHEKMFAGVPLNPDSVQSAIMAVNTGVNPETGEPLSGDPMEVQDILEKASLQPKIADNHPVHIDTHGLFMQSLEFEQLPPEIQRRFNIHFSLTQQALPKPQGENSPKANLNLRAAIGPTTVAELLRSTGVEVPAEIIAAEPPMETWVTDSVDKPDVDAGSPGMEGSKEIQDMLIQAQAAKHDDDQGVEKTRKAKAEADFAEKKAKQGPPKPSKSSGKKT